MRPVRGIETRRKCVAIVAPDFVPSGTPPALRVRFFATHLQEYGWDPIVIATDPGWYDWQTDPENVRLLPANLDVIRTPALPLSWTRKVGIGDIGLRTLMYQWQALRRLCRAGRVDAVFISISPFYTAVLGRLIWQEFKIPYIIDYIDPWVNDFYLTQPTAQRPGGRKWILAHRIARLIEPFALKHVAQLTSVSHATMDGIYRRYPWLADVDTTEIPYGGEPGDWDYVHEHPRRNHVFDRNDGYFHICYVGTVGAGMRSTIRALFAALRCGLDRKPARFDKLRLHFVGTTYAAGAHRRNQVLDIAEETGVTAAVSEHPGRIPYLDTLQVLSDSSALIVIGSEEPHYTASKLFPYILAGRPLLAIAHESSSIVRIMQDTGAGSVTTFNDSHPSKTRVTEIMTSLDSILSLPVDWQATTRWDAFQKYTTASMTALLVQVLDHALVARGR
jgi:Glycosyl transferase 4-like domain